MAVIDTAENIANMEYLRAYAQEQKMMVAFTGAGTSVFPGIPAWKRFVTALNETLNTRLDINTIIEIHGVLAAASQIYDALPAGSKHLFYEGITEIVQRTTRFDSYDLHTYIISFFNRIVTTNYDTSFEKEHVAHNFALVQAGHQGYSFAYEAIPTLSYTRFLTTDKSIAYLHGRIETDQIILRKEDYARYYPTINSYAGADISYNLEEFLEPLIENYSFVFIGFSLDDEDFVKTFELLNEKIKKRLSTTRPLLEQYEEKKHFIIISHYDLKDWIDLRDLINIELDPAELIRRNILQYKLHSNEKLELRLNYTNQFAGLSPGDPEKIESLAEMLKRNKRKLDRLKDLNILDIRYDGQDYNSIKEVLKRNGRTVASSDSISVNDL